jgi:hypothetical protein
MRWGSALAATMSLLGLATMAWREWTHTLALVLDVTLYTYMLVYFGWMTYMTWHAPALRLSPEAIEWRHPISRRFEWIERAQVVAWRWVGFSIYVRLAAGDERGIHFVSLSGRKPRLGQAVEAWLEAATGRPRADLAVPLLPAPAR